MKNQQGPVIDYETRVISHPGQRQEGTFSWKSVFRGFLFSLLSD